MKKHVLEQIINLSSFKQCFDTLHEVDPDMSQNIMQSISSSVGDTHQVLEDPLIQDEQLKIALLQEKLSIQAQASQYLNISEQMAFREKELWRFTSEATELFFDTLYRGMDEYFIKKEVLMFDEIQSDGEWYTGIRDAAKKAGVLVNWVVKKANDVSREMTGSKLTSNDEVIDDRTIVERVMEKYLPPSEVSNDMSQLMETAANVYQEAWKNLIKKQVPDMERLSAFSLAKQASDSIIVDFKLGVSEQTFMVGMGSAVVGTLGLAAGWHTITYALMNVFPPIALFALAATVVLGVLTKEQAIEQRKKQVREAVKHYQRYFMMQFDVVPLSNLDELTLRKYMNKMGEKIVVETMKQWQERLFGNLKVEHYRMINTAFSRHLLLIQEAFDDISQF